MRAILALVAVVAGCTFDPGPDVPDAPTFEEGTHLISDVATLLAGPGAEADAGSALVAGDFDGDGRMDLAVGAPGRDGVSVYTDVEDAPHWIEGPPGSRFGSALAAGDFDGDGTDELVIGAPEHADRDDDGPDSTGLARGAVFVHRLDGLLATVPGSSPGDCAGAAVAADDVTGDGLADLLVGAPCRGSYRYEDPAIALTILAQGPGVAWLMGSPLVGDASVGDALATYPGIEDFDQAGAAVLFANLDDRDGPDVVIGAPDYYGAEWVNPSGRGHARVWSGDARGELHASDAFLIVRGGCCGADLFDETGSSLAAGDLDGDGHDELLVGAPEAVDFGILGATWLVPGPASGELDGLQTTVLAAAPKDQGESGSEMGRALASGFDLDSDGVLELAIGGPTDARSIDGGGVVQILEGLPDGYTELFSTGTILTATASNQALGSAFAWGDFDGDGRDELAVGAPGDRTVGHRAGGVYLVDLSN